MNKEKIIELAKRRTAKDVYDAMQGLEYTLAASQASSGQTPFVSVNFGLGESWYAREIQKSILKVREEGLGKGKKTSVFPKLIFTLKRGTNLEKDDPNYDIKQQALRCSAKRIYPDVLNYDKTIETTGSFKAPMGCRSFLPAYQDPHTGEEVTEGRMNLGVVSLNLPRIAMEAAGDRDKFWEILDERMDVMHQALKYRIQRCCEVLPENAPILYKEGAFGKRLKDGDDVSVLFKDGRSTVSFGYIGLYEVGVALFGAGWEDNDEAVEFIKDVLKKLSSETAKWSEEEGFKYSVYATPSESLTDRFCRLDTERFGEVENITDKGFYVNSFHMDTRKKVSPFEKLDFERQFLPHTTAGQICYVETNVSDNVEALETLWDYAYDRVMYFGANTPTDNCLRCDFHGETLVAEDGYTCPDCGNSDSETLEVIRRLCGYLGSLNMRPAVSGRQKEIKSRVKHS